jgi:type VI secretion system secreted protein VgrG
MATFTDSNRFLKLTTPLGPDKLLVLGFAGEERISGLFEVALDLIAPRNEIPDPARLIGKGATLAVNHARANAFEAEGKRTLHGIINQFAEVGALHGTQGGETFEYLRFRATLVPWFWNLTRAADCRVFQDKTVPQIIEQVFKDRGFSDYRLALSGTHSPRKYCVQYRETDFAFLSRLMEEEGIFYFFEHKDGEHKLALADAKSVHQACGPAAGIPYKQQRQVEAGAVRSWTEQHVITTAKYAVQSYNFETPSTSLLASVDTTVTAGKNTSLEVYDFPQSYGTKSAGDQDAKLRMEAIEAQHHSCEGASDCAYMTPGFTFKLTDHYRADQNTEYLVAAVKHEARNSGYEQLIKDHTVYYRNSFVCMPKAVQYRAPAVTPKPRIQGVQTALVVGPSGEEIYTDSYGRVKVQFYWDRKGKKDGDSSCWIRVVQTLASNQWGAQFIPRIGQEVLVDFVDGDPDQPLVTGALYNAQKMPPYKLPDNRTQSGLKTRSSKDGTADNFNEIRFEDKKGSEDVYFHAEKDFHRVVKNDDDLKVGHDQTIEVKNSRTETVKEGDETVTIEKGKRTVKVAQGDDKLTVAQGNRTVEITMGNHTLQVKQGNQVTKVDLGKSEMEAMQSIEFKVGGNSIKIDQTGVTIKGTMVKIEGTASAEMKAATVKVEGSAQTEIKAGAMVKVEGAMVQINGSGMTQVKAGGMVQVQGAINMIG